jgi:hypothetical protein
MKAYLKIAALACVVSVVSIGIAPAEITREDAVKKCWEKAHQESPVSSGSEVNTSALAKGAFRLYAACMVEHGYQP